RGKAHYEYRHKKQTGGRGQFGEVHLRLEPRKRGEGFEFVDEVKGGVVPNQYIPAVEKGVIAGMERGPLAGYPVVDVRAALFFGKYASHLRSITQGRGIHESKVSHYEDVPRELADKVIAAARAEKEAGAHAS